MAPSFVPKEERKRKLEKKAIREAMEEKRKFQAAKKLAEKIAKAYRKDREEKWPWDQHDSTKREVDANKLARDIYLGMKRAEYERAAEIEKRPKKKQGGLKIGRSSTIEGISEAIGNKFKETIQRSRETSEKSATKSAESNKSKESAPKEKNASESRQDRKRRPKTKETGTKERPVEGSRKRRESRASERKATKTATEHSRGGVSDSSGKNVKEKKRRAKGISDTDDRKPHRKGEHVDNSKKRELEIWKPVRDERKGRVYEVKMYRPEIRGVHFRSSEDLRKYIDTELSGMKHLPYFKKMMSDAEGHLKLSAGIGDRKELALSEIRGLSAQTGVPFRTTRNWVYKEGKPSLYALAEDAITKSEAKVILNKLRNWNNGIESVEDVQARFNRHSLGQHIRELKSYERDLEISRRYFRFIESLSEGGLLSDIARRVGINDVTAMNWRDGVYPVLVKRAIELPREVSKADYPLAENKDSADSKPFTRHGGKIRMRRPELNGQTIESLEHLRAIVEADYPGIKHMKGFGKLMHEAGVHLQILGNLGERQYLEYGEVMQLAKQFGVKPYTLRTWVTKENIPKLYHRLRDGVSKSEAMAQIERIRVRNNGLTSIEEFHKRLHTYYLAYKEQTATFYERELALAKRYFKFLALYAAGGSFADIARRAGSPESSVRGWLGGLQPRLIRVIAGVPKELPLPGQKWLPLKFIDGKYPANIIEVPNKIQSHEEIMQVLRQVKPTENEFMRNLNVRYGRRSIEEEFMYLLGAYISDGSSFNKTTLARSIGIRLSKTYPWSFDFGEGLCQSLGACGIYAHRVENTPAKTTYKRTETGVVPIHQNVKFNWASENSPLLHWIHRSCLGYNDTVPKREQPVTADWILNAPFDMRRAVLQGLGDGDGSASVQGNYICISSKNNKQFIEKLIQTFGVKTRLARKDVVTTGMAEAKKAAQIPPFRYAKTRLEASKRMTRRIDAKRRVRDNPLKPKEIEFILSMKREGMTAWKANEAFFDKFGTAIHNEVIKRLYRKSSQRKEKEEKS